MHQAALRHHSVINLASFGIVQGSVRDHSVIISGSFGMFIESFSYYFYPWEPQKLYQNDGKGIHGNVPNVGCWTPKSSGPRSATREFGASGKTHWETKFGFPEASGLGDLGTKSGFPNQLVDQSAPIENR